MTKKTVTYDLFVNGESEQREEEVLLHDARYSDKAIANSEAKDWHEENGGQPSNEALMVSIYLRKGDGERLTYSEVMDAEIPRANALYSHAVVSFMGVRDPKKD